MTGSSLSFKNKYIFLPLQWRSLVWHLLNQSLWSPCAQNAVMAGVWPGSPLPQEMTSCLSRWLKETAFWWVIWKLTALIKCYIPLGSLVSSLALSPQEDRSFETLVRWQEIKGSPFTSSQFTRKELKSGHFTEKVLHSACIFLIFSLTRYFRKLLESAFNLFQRSQKQRFLLHCYIHAWPGFKISIFVGFFFFFWHQPYSSEWKLLVFKAADEIGPTVSLCVLGCIEIEFSYFLNQKSVLLSDKYEWPHGDNRTEYLKLRMLWTIWGHVVSVPTRAWLHSNLVKAKWLLLCVWVHGWDRLTICYCLLSFSSVSEWC